MKLPRMWQWYLATLILLAIVALVAPQQIQVVLYKVSMVTLAAVIAFTLDRSLFRILGERETDSNRAVFDVGRMISRALVFIGVVLGVTLGI